MADSAPTAANIVAVDGPAAAGKTTTATILADRFGLGYLESGRAYRLMAYLALRHSVRLDSEDDLIELYQCHFGTPERATETLAEHSGRDDLLRRREIDLAVSTVASLPGLRAEITDLIRTWATTGRGSCVEGRDIGTTVFPAATVKFFLTAVPEVRARRRLADRNDLPYEDVLADVRRRDRADEQRAVSPLVPAADSVLIDTSDLSVIDVVTRMSAVCADAGLRAVPPSVTGQTR